VPPISSQDKQDNQSRQLTSTKEKLKLYKNTPTNGLVLYCGVILMEDGKTEKKITFDFEPFKPINQFLYFCDNSFKTDPL